MAPTTEKAAIPAKAIVKDSVASTINPISGGARVTPRLRHKVKTPKPRLTEEGVSI